MTKNKVIKKEKKKYIAITILTIIFISSFILGLIPIYPFGTYEKTGDIIVPRLTLLTKIPIYPLVIINNFFNNINLLPEDMEIFYIFISGFILIFYYYILSRILIYLYIKIKKIMRKKGIEEINFYIGV